MILAAHDLDRNGEGDEVRIDDYHEFTRALVDNLALDGRVIGLVALGSMAEIDYLPDEWSDHDFFVVTRPGEQESLRTALSWLPAADEIALAYRETEHGVKAIYGDGHLVEFAVFDLDELRLASIGRFRVLLDSGGVADRVAEVAGARVAAPRLDELHHFGQFVTHVLVGCGRCRRGETISGSYFVKGLAVRDLMALVSLAIPSPHATLLDDLDPTRRVDVAYPEIATEIGSLLRGDTVEAGLGLLELAERAVRPRVPDLPWNSFEIVRSRVAR